MAKPSNDDVHAILQMQEALAQGCTCEYGCRDCKMHVSQMGNCPAFHDWSCPLGREANPDCPLNGKSLADLQINGIADLQTAKA